MMGEQIVSSKGGAKSGIFAEGDENREIRNPLGMFSEEG